MDVLFPETGFSAAEKGEIDDVLHRISIGEQDGEWREWPDEVKILKRLSGGRSGSEVLEVVVKRGTQQARKVIKVGPARDLENEFQAFRRNLPNPSALFVPIEAATPVALGKSRPRRGEREAVVYDHVARFQGVPHGQTRSFEEIAREAVRQDGALLERTIKVLQTLFGGIHNDLYDIIEDVKRHTKLHDFWNRRLGIDAVVAVDQVDSIDHRLWTTYKPLFGDSQEKLWPLDIANASVRVDGKVAKGDLVSLHGARMIWQDTRLVAVDSQRHLRIEVVPDKIPMSQLLSSVEDGSTWTLDGQLVSLRMETHRERLLKGLGDDFRLSKDILTGPGASVRDPFAALPDVMENRRPHRITSMIHGDLNPRNILVIDETPCLIDYALTRKDEPILMDFTRLEGCLARDVLPADFTWAQHVRLQRLLAAACRLGDEAAQRFAGRLAADRAELGSAFRLLWTIRQAAREIYPQEHKDQWVRDYLEQLFLFAHLSLKWVDREELVPQKLHATAAMASVAAEALSEGHIYDMWSEEALHEDGGEIIQIVRSRPQTSLSELANLARVWHNLDPKKDAVLYSAFEDARADFVRHRFHDDANDAIIKLASDHEVYISLKAYIDLKGQLRAGYRRGRQPIEGMYNVDELTSFEEMLETDELLAESELLRARSDAGDDVLRLVAENPAVVLIGDAGSGKSTVAREWEYHLANSIVDQNKNASSSKPTTLTNVRLPIIEPRMPIVLRAPNLPERLQNWDAHKLQSTVEALGYGQSSKDLLTIGALYIIVDALNELADEQKQRVADWIVALRDAFPSTPMLVCHRQYNYVPGLLPFPVVTLQKVEAGQARVYIYDYLREKDIPNHEQLARHLVKLLLENPDHVQVRDLAQTPLFLWMIVERYRQTGDVPRSRGRLFETFSRWYLEERYHESYREQTKTKYSYKDKALLLGALGYELVQRRATDLPEKQVQQLVPKSIIDDWQALLEEIIAAEMLYHDGENLRFLHQSFQEYFAARHFLDTQGKDPAAIRQKVWQFGWHDTFTVLLGFAGHSSEVVTRVIEEALKVNPLLTARCLRMAEQPDPVLLDRFVSTQEAILKNAQAGEFAHQRAAQALAEHGRGPTRAALWRVVAAPDAPDTARIAALQQLAAMPVQIRFEPVKERILQELENYLPPIFDKSASVAVQLAAINAIVTTQLNDMGMYLGDLIMNGEWPLCRAAWQACGKLGLKLTRGQQAVFINACRERLDKAEEELYQETSRARMDELNKERVYILRQLAAPVNLPLLLKRRFNYAIGDEVGAIIEQVVQMERELPAEAQDTWEVLIQQPEEATSAVDRWLELLRHSDDLVAIAAVHRLIKFARKIPSRDPRSQFAPTLVSEQPITLVGPNDLSQPGEMVTGEKLRPFLNKDLLPDRLSAVAHLVKACPDKSLSEPLEALIRLLIETVADSLEFEALANLLEALKALDSRLWNRIAAVANAVFWTSRDEAIQRRYFPWRNVSSSIYLGSKDYRLLLAAGGNDARAAVFRLSSYGSGILCIAEKNEFSTMLDDAMYQLQYLARNEQKADWQFMFASASVKVHAVELLPWLIDLAHAPEMAQEQVNAYDSQYGMTKERYLSNIFRAIGYLARILLDEKRADEASLAIAFLRECYATLLPNEERSIVVGLTTGLGFLGDWESILTHLGPEEPWMHQAAQNVFEYWVPTPLKKASAEEQRKEAATWIARRLRDRLDLVPQARSTLERIKDGLEIKLGRHIQVEDV